MAIIRTENLHRTYHLDGEDVHAVNNVTLEVSAQKMTAVVGRSGSGKTTFMNLVSGLDNPTSGDVWFEDRRLNDLTEPERLQLRRDKLGFVFQTFGLLPLLSAAENVSIPLRMQHIDPKVRQKRIEQALEWVGLSHRMHHRSYELSGGEQQRVAIARSLVTQPTLIFADEPTGQLDSVTGQKIIALLRRLVEEQGITALIVTHDPKVMQEADIVHELRDGQLIETRFKN